jgi:hypothetical protein
MDAYPSKPVGGERALEIVRGMVPTAPFQEALT